MYHRFYNSSGRWTVRFCTIDNKFVGTIMADSNFCHNCANNTLFKKQKLCLNGNNSFRILFVLYEYVKLMSAFLNNFFFIIRSLKELLYSFWITFQYFKKQKITFFSPPFALFTIKYFVYLYRRKQTIIKIQEPQNTQLDN